MTEAIKIFGLLIFSGVKFFLAPSTAIISGYTFLETILITTAGGIGGVITFFYFGEFMQYLFRRRKSKKEKKKFTRFNRYIIKVKSTYGLVGLALLTPCLLSIPLGALLAARYFDDDKRTLPFLLASVVIWSLVLTTATSLIH